MGGVNRARRRRPHPARRARQAVSAASVAGMVVLSALMTVDHNAHAVAVGDSLPVADPPAEATTPPSVPAKAPGAGDGHPPPRQAGHAAVDLVDQPRHVGCAVALTRSARATRSTVSARKRAARTAVVANTRPAVRKAPVVVRTPAPRPTPTTAVRKPPARVVAATPSTRPVTRSHGS